MKPILALHNVTKQYGAINAVKGISFEVQPGEVFALIGPNGAGKSTTLRMIATLLKPTSGSITVAGHDVEKEAEKVREVISYLPEESGSYKNVTGSTYLHYMSELFTNDPEKQRDMLARGKEISRLGDRLNDKASTYSKGMTRKLLLARAVMSLPNLCILDEPTSGLDVINARDIRTTIREFADQGMTVLLSSHNMLEIEFLSDRVGLIANGTIHDIGTAAELKKKYKATNLEDVFINATQS